MIEAIGELSVLDGNMVQPHLHTLVPLIMRSLWDQSSTRRREVSLRALTQLFENTGYVIIPYFHYPDIMLIIQDLIKTETNKKVRRLVFRFFGTIGALDPFLMKKIEQAYEGSNVADDYAQYFDQTS